MNMNATGIVDYGLNRRAARVMESLTADPDRYRVAVHEINGATVVDCGIEIEGGTAAGLVLARACLSELGRVQLVGVSSDDIGMARINVSTDHPAAACMASQYAGWQISHNKYFAMGSGPMRALAKTEALFDDLQIVESSDVAVGILETRQLPNGDVIELIAEKTGVKPAGVRLLVAPTASIAGSIQVVARSIETCLHKMHELKFDLGEIQSGSGTAPLPPAARNDLGAIGRTNDAILYGASVALWCRSDDEVLEEIGPSVPASGSVDYGEPFAEIFRQADYDFYKIDPNLFSPAEVVLHNMDSGRSFRFGRRDDDVLRKSFGL